MSESTLEEIISFKNRHKFFVFITSSIVLAIVITTISMALYNSSGTAQLDLSRPGYKSVRAQSINEDSGFTAFSSFGELNPKVIKDFKTLYNQRTQKIKSVDAFGGDPLSPEALNFVTTDPALTN